ncbi:MAG: glycosyltransferase family 2 protein [Bacteroidota bacterium]
MYKNHRISLIIPCYNEEEGLPFVLEKVPDLVDEIVIVDNNSTDMTADIGEKGGARVFREMQQGYGYAYHKGFAEATGDIFVTMDGDGTYPPEEIPRLLEELEGEGLDFISACRFPLSNKKNMDPVSKFGNWVLTTMTRILFGYGLKDSQSGMWVFRKSALEKIVLKSNGMPFSEEIKIEAIRRGLKFKESHIPYHLRYGEKKIKKFRDGIRNLVFLFRLRFRK